MKLCPTHRYFFTGLGQAAWLPGWRWRRSASLGGAQATAAPENRFETPVRAYEAADWAEPPPPGAIMLVGDSQFCRWKTLREDLPGYTIIKRGIDSFQSPDVGQFCDRPVRLDRPRP